MPARRGHCRYGPCRAPRQTRRDARSRSGDDADQLRRTLVPQGPPFLKVRSCFGEAESEPTRSSRGAEAPLLHDIKFWREFAGWHGSFRDPWGTQIILWTEASDDDPEIPSDVPY